MMTGEMEHIFLALRYRLAIEYDRPHFPSSLIAHQGNFENRLGIGLWTTPIWIGKDLTVFRGRFKDSHFL